jgi:predicted cupin superfamily sugar epimerase
MEKKSSFYIDFLGLKPHPEGGYFREVYRSDEMISADSLPERYNGSRSFATSIYFLLEREQVSKFHRLKSDEIWHFYEGSPVRIYIIDEKKKLSEMILGRNLPNGHSFQLVIKRGCWFAAEVIDKKSFSLFGCSVSPGFDFRDYEEGIDEKLLADFVNLGPNPGRFR